jgi:hypothetical protein
MVLLKNFALWDGSPPGSAGVPNLFGLSPLTRRLVVEKAPNELGIPTGWLSFNKVLDTLRTRPTLTGLTESEVIHA